MWKVDRHFVSRSIFRWFRVLGWTSISGFITISQAFTDYWLVGSLQSPVGLIQLSFSPGSNLKLRHRPQVRASHLKTWKVLWPTQRSRPVKRALVGLAPPNEAPSRLRIEIWSTMNQCFFCQIYGMWGPLLNTFWRRFHPTPRIQKSSGISNNASDKKKSNRKFLLDKHLTHSSLVRNPGSRRIRSTLLQDLSSNTAKRVPHALALGLKWQVEGQVVMFTFAKRPRPSFQFCGISATVERFR